jgi:hypothetical protein
VYVELVEKRNKTSDFITHYRTVCKRNHWKEHIAYVELVSEKKTTFSPREGRAMELPKNRITELLQKKPLERAHSVCRTG